MSYKSKFMLFAAGMALRSRPRKALLEELPVPLQGFPGDAYVVPEVVVDTWSLLRNFSIINDDVVAKVDETEFDTVNGRILAVWAKNGSEQIVFPTRYVILTAGAGNKCLRKELGLPGGMQRRPLFMTVAKGMKTGMFGHLVDSSSPVLTITSEVDGNSNIIWKIGGRIAEEGVIRSSDEQIEAVSSMVRQEFPNYVDDNVLWTTYRVDRAEPKESLMRLPGDAYVSVDKNVITAWPTKMVLAPRLADKVMKSLSNPSGDTTIIETGLPYPEVANPPWYDSTTGWKKLRS